MEPLYQYRIKGGIFLIEMDSPMVIMGGGVAKDHVMDILKKVNGIGDQMAEELYKRGLRSIRDVAKSAIVSHSIRMSAKYYHDLQQTISVNLASRFNAWLKLKLLGNNVEGIVECFVVGSHRRDAATSHDIDLLVTFDKTEISDDHYKDKLTSPITETLLNEDVIPLEIGEKVITVLKKLRGYMRAIDIYTCPVEETGAALIRRTGPKEFVIAIQKFAKLIGMQIKATGLYNEKGRKITSKSEKDIFDGLGIDFIPPKRRSDETLIQWIYEEGHKRSK